MQIPQTPHADHPSLSIALFLLIRSKITNTHGDLRSIQAEQAVSAKVAFP